MAAAPALIHECSHKQSSCQVRIHFHNAYELLFVKKGNMRININGNVYDGSPGSVFVIGRFEEHELEARSAGMSSSMPRALSSSSPNGGCSRRCGTAARISATASMYRRSSTGLPCFSAVY